MLRLHITQPCRSVGDSHEYKITIKGSGGKKINTRIGTLKWHWEEVQDKVHTFTIPNPYDVPEGELRQVSPQHRSQTRKDIKPKPDTKETTNYFSCAL